MNTMEDFVLEGCGHRVSYKAVYSNGESQLVLTGSTSE